MPSLLGLTPGALRRDLAPPDLFLAAGAFVRERARVADRLRRRGEARAERDIARRAWRKVSHQKLPVEIERLSSSW